MNQTKNMVLFIAVLPVLFVLLLLSCTENNFPENPLQKDETRLSLTVEKTTEHYTDYSVDTQIRLYEDHKTYVDDYKRIICDNKNVTDNCNKVPDAWAAWNEKDNFCFVAIRKIQGMRDEEYFALLGHEITHCTHGTWHPKGWY